MNEDYEEKYLDIGKRIALNRIAFCGHPEWLVQ